MRLSLIISTYNRLDALRAVIAGVSAQIVPPHEVLVADDGSGPETKKFVNILAAAGLPIRHVWHEDQGFRLSAIRNRAVALATGDYLVFIDGDIFPHRSFISDHIAAARPGFFVQGSRAILDETATKNLLDHPIHLWPELSTPGVGNRKNLLRSLLLSRLFSGERSGLKGIRACNFAFWRDDVIRVNGFNEDFVGWGREDSEFVTRLMNAGVKRRNLRFAALCCHLHHPPQSRANLGDNDALLARTIAEKLTRCQNGVDKYLPVSV